MQEYFDCHSKSRLTCTIHLSITSDACFNLTEVRPFLWWRTAWVEWINMLNWTTLIVNSNQARRIHLNVTLIQVNYTQLQQVWSGPTLMWAAFKYNYGIKHWSFLCSLFLTTSFVLTLQLNGLSGVLHCKILRGQPATLGALKDNITGTCRSAGNFVHSVSLPRALGADICLWHSICPIQMFLLLSAAFKAPKCNWCWTNQFLCWKTNAQVMMKQYTTVQHCMSDFVPSLMAGCKCVQQFGSTLIHRACLTPTSNSNLQSTCQALEQQIARDCGVSCRNEVAPWCGASLYETHMLQVHACTCKEEGGGRCCHL